MALLRADIENKAADTSYKQGLLKWEPWKVLALGLGAGAAITATVAGLAGYRLGQNTPQQATPIIIQLAPGVVVAPPVPALPK